MSTFGDLKARIYQEMHATLSAETHNAVLSAVAHYQSNRFWFNEANATFVASLTTLYALSAAIPGLVKLDAIKAWWGNVPYALSPESYSDLDAMDRGTSSGTPSSYAIHHEMLRIYPKPSQTITIEVAYHKQITLSASNTASSVWTNEAVDLIRHRAKGLLYATVLRNEKAAMTEQTLEQQVLDRLSRQTVKLTSSGKVRGYL